MQLIKSIRDTLVSFLEELDNTDGKTGGDSSLQKYLKSHHQLLSMRLAGAPIIDLLYWDSENKAREFEKYCGDKTRYRIFSWPDSSFNPTLNDKFKGIERHMSDRIIDKANSNCSIPGKTVSGAWTFSAKDYNGEFKPAVLTSKKKFVEQQSLKIRGGEMMRAKALFSVVWLVLLLSSFANSQFDPDSGLVAYWSFDDSTAYDFSGNGHHGSIYGPTPVPGKSGTAMSFDGLNDYINIGNGVKPPFPATVSIWVKPDILRTNVFLRNDVWDSSYYRYGLGLYYRSDGRIEAIYFEGYSTSSNRVNTISNDPIVVIDEWHNFTAVFNGHRNVKLFWDGEEIPSYYDGTGSGMSYSGASGALGHHRPPDSYYDGALDEVRVYNRALADNEVSELYYSTNAGNALVFDGSNDLVNIPGSGNYAFGSGDFTIDMWINPSYLAGNFRVLFCNRNLDNCQFNITPGGALELYGGGQRIIVSSNLSWELGNWYHVAVTRISGNLGMYRDTLQVASAYNTRSVGNTTNINIGTRNYYVSHPFNGMIDQVRVWNVGKTQEEISAIYNQAIDPSTSGLVGYWDFNEEIESQDVIDLSPFSNNGTLGNNSSVGTDDPSRVLSTAPIIGHSPANHDLQVTNVSVPDEGWTGLLVDIEWTVANNGVSSIENEWLDYIFLSSDNAIGNDSLVDSLLFTNGIAPGDSVNTIQSILIPVDAPSNYWVVIQTDAHNQIVESGYENNNIRISTGPITIHQSDYPDLVVSNIEASDTATSGQTVGLSWIVTNTGNMPTDAPLWYDKAYLSIDSVLDGNDYLLGNFQNPHYLIPGQSYIQNVSGSVPWGLSGPYNIIIFTDANDHLNEHSGEGNNTGASDSSTYIVIDLQPAPDLEVVINPNPIIPSAARVGDPITVGWTVTNIGDASASGEWLIDWIMLSEDNIPGSGDFHPGGGYPHNYFTGDDLGPDESYTRTGTVYLDNSLDAGTYYLFVWTDVRMEYPDRDLSNNFSQLYEIEILPRNPTDLQVTSVSMDQTDINSGSLLQIEWTVTNIGPEDLYSSSWTDAVYLSPDTSFMAANSGNAVATYDGNFQTKTRDGHGIDLFNNSSRDQQVLSYTFSGNLLIDSSYTIVDTIAIPNEYSGLYNLEVCTDVNNNVNEDNLDWEDNNCTNVTSSLQVNFTPVDLQVSSIVPPSNAWSGQTEPIQWTVVNAGTGRTAIESWADKAYLSSDDSLDIELDILLLEYDHNGALPPSDDYTVNLNLDIPNGLQGDYYVFVLTDVDNNIFEDDQEDNNINSESFAINLTPPPDLQVTELIAPDSAFSGQSINIQWAVINAGIGNTAASMWWDKLYLSSDSAYSVDGDDLLLSLSQSGILDAGSGYMENREITIASGIEGRYYLKVYADADDEVYEYQEEDNNKYIIPIVLTIPEPGDLQLSDLIVTDFQSSDQAIAGDTLTLSWTILNQGEFPTPSNINYWLDGIYISADDILEIESDLRIGQASYHQVLQPESSYTVNRTIDLPDGIEGQWYLFVMSDYSNLVEEVIDANNSALDSVYIQLLPPDLAVVSVTVPDSADCGQPFDVSWIVINQGIGATKVSSWYDGVYLSHDQVIDGNDYVLESYRNESILKEDSTYSMAISPEIPLGLSGSYYVIVETDKNDDVYEYVNENNNSTTTQDIFQVIIPEPGNLVVTSIDAPDSVIAGEEITISWTVENVDTLNDVSGLWTDAVYLSEDTLWNFDDPLIGTAEHSEVLLAGTSYSKSLTLDIADFLGDLEDDMPGVIPGDYHTVVWTDIRNNIYETDETDNIGYSDSLVSVEVSELTLGVPDSAVLNTGDEHYYRVEVVENGDLKIRINMQSQVDLMQLYVGFGEIPDLIHYDWKYEVYDDFEIVIPSELQEVCYFMLKDEFVSDSCEYVILADEVPFGIDAFFPAQGGNDGFVTVNLTGSGFDESAVPSLNYNSTVVRPLRLKVNNRTSIDAIFDLNEAEIGNYNVIVITDGDTSIASETFAVETGLGLLEPLTANLSGPSVIRRGGSVTYTATVENLSNIDVEYVLLSFFVGNFNGTSIDMMIDEEWDDDDPYSDDEYIFKQIIIPNLSAGSEIQIPIRVSNIFESTTSLVVVRPRSEQYMQSIIENRGRYFREILLTNTDILGEFPDLDSLLIQEDKWVAFWLYAMARYGIIGIYDDFWDEVPLSTANWKNLTNGALYLICRTAIKAFATAGENPILIPNPLGPPIQWPGWGPAGTEVVDHLLSPACDWIEELPDDWEFPHWNPPDYTPEEWMCGIAGIPFRPLFHQRDEDDDCPPIPGSSFIPLTPIYPRDPNEKVGPTGPDEDNLVTTHQTLPYTIYFENTPDATAPAVNVVITDQLDENLDWRYFRLNEIAFGNTNIVVPGNRSYWHTIVDLDSLGLILEIDAGLNAYTGESHWYFNTIDPETGQPPTDPFAGFLPPNDSTGKGEGHVSFAIKAHDELEDGTEIANSATIVFGINDPIETNEVVNVIYSAAPDLVVSSAGVDMGNTTLKIYSPAYLVSTIENQGGFDADSFYTSLFLGDPDSGGVLLDQAWIENLSAGQYQEVDLTWIPEEEITDGSLYFYADFEDSITEMDESNNSRIVIVDVVGGYAYFRGDANMSFGIWPPAVIGGDVTYLVNYFRGLENSPPCPLDGYYCSADVNGDCLVIGSDVTRLVNYFRGLSDILYCTDYETLWPAPDDLPEIEPSGWPNCETATAGGTIPSGAGK
ncbi:MAG: hypothetical protein GY839_10225 [candidate division Zixibacteria bacterium]|nr:hypothetical protein [candidate division Zixibacteria bacterium]